MAHQLNLNTTALEELKAKAQALPAEKKVQASKSVTPGTTEQTVTPDSGYDGLASVSVAAMPTGSVGTPSISVDSAGKITATTAVDAGYVDGTDKTGTKQLTVQAAQTITPGTSNKTIASGQYLTGTQTIKGDANLVAGNIKSGTSIFGVTGTLSSGFPNGTEWTKSNLTNVSIKTIHYGNGIWVAGGASTGGLYYSTDGKNWIQSNVTNKTANVTAYADGIHVAGLSDGLYYSTDGKSWTRASNITVNTYALSNGNGIWLTGVYGGSIYWSDDGITWTKNSVSPGFPSTSNPVYANGIWVSGTSSAGLRYSTDGMTWTKSNITSGGTGWIAYADGMFICSSGSLNSSNGIYYSTDGKTWSLSNLGSGFYMNSATRGNGKWVIGTNDGVYYSTDGQTWVVGDSKDAVKKVHYADGIWVALRANSGFIYSIDGLTWNASSVSSEKGYSLHHANGIWVVGSAHGIYYSVTWEPST